MRSFLKNNPVILTAFGVIWCFLFSSPCWALTETNQQARSLTSYTMGVVYDLYGMPENALREYEKAASGNESSTVYLRMGADYARLGRLEDAISSLSQTLAREPENVQARYLLALIYSSQHKFDKAAEEYESILQSFSKAEPKNVEIYGYLGQLYYSQKKYRKAIDQFEIVLSLDSKNTDVLYLLGSLYLEMQDREKAKEYFRKAIAINPDHDGCLNSLGYLYAEEGDKLDEALKLVERALKIDPENGAYLDSMGWIYYKKGDYEKALSYFEQADSQIKDPVIYEHLGDVYFKLQKPAEAHKYWQQSLDLLPGQDQVLHKIEQLN